MKWLGDRWFSILTAFCGLMYAYSFCHIVAFGVGLCGRPSYGLDTIAVAFAWAFGGLLTCARENWPKADHQPELLFHHPV